MSLVVVPNVFTYLFPKMEVITRKWNSIMDCRGREHNLDTDMEAQKMDPSHIVWVCFWPPPLDVGRKPKEATD
jgi:hypothetical protein